MKNLILSVAIVAVALFASAGTAEAKCCFKKKPAIKKCCKKTTVEVCRRYFCVTKCVCGCWKTINYVEVTYRTTDCCGRCTIWKKTSRC